MPFEQPSDVPVCVLGVCVWGGLSARHHMNNPACAIMHERRGEMCAPKHPIYTHRSQTIVLTLPRADPAHVRTGKSTHVLQRTCIWMYPSSPW
jgi:hypothetical protein